ncbi:hypothetical protein NQ176_g8238 [Zarea fungicola]|uniref:Uncharacterized protein n=1 Tax=Zarea fungicola TaxID=93591 RepID=A0ACC1MTL4_9HYPO|nr:hypothetical protein NQ176_g8238 [Lecanicillium fungicola]
MDMELVMSRLRHVRYMPGGATSANSEPVGFLYGAAVSLEWSRLFTSIPCLDAQIHNGRRTSLTGNRALELPGLTTAPFAGMMLADAGATILRIKRYNDAPDDMLARRKSSMSVKWVIMC